MKQKMLIHSDHQGRFVGQSQESKRTHLDTHPWRNDFCCSCIGRYPSKAAGMRAAIYCFCYVSIIMQRVRLPDRNLSQIESLPSENMLATREAETGISKLPLTMRERPTQPFGAKVREQR